MINRFQTRAEAFELQNLCLLNLHAEELIFVLDSCGSDHDPYSRYEWLIAWGVKHILRIRENGLDVPLRIREFCGVHKKQWIFSYLEYDLKNSLENLDSRNLPRVGFDLACLLVPQNVITCRQKDGEYVVEGDFPEEPILPRNLVPGSISEIRVPDFERYAAAYGNVQRHIQRGDIFEANLCIEFCGFDCNLDPWEFRSRMQAISPAPFSCFLRDGSRFLISASPERFLQGDSHRVIAQPMKGTASRSADPAEDEINRMALLGSEKERAENIMIVDLVRNDLGRSAQDGSVEVLNICEVIPYAGIWQMISTVACKPRPELLPLDIILNAFPMGSMTGAPKVRAMEVIDQNEDFARGLFSGSVGYINPDGEYDFNVIIRSLFYDEDAGTVSFAAGGAITSDAECRQEYRECLLKAGAIYRTLTGETLPDH